MQTLVVKSRTRKFVAALALLWLVSSCPCAQVTIAKRGARGALHAALLLLTLLVCGTSARAQTTTIPVEIRGVLIFVPVEINGKSAKFLLDTGAAGNFITPAAVERLGLKPLDEKKLATVVGTGGAVQNIPFAALGEYKVGGLAFTGQEASVMNFPVELECDGTLGAPFLRKQVVVINYQRKILQLISDENPAVLGSLLPLRIVNDIPCVKLRFGDYQGYFRMDLGDTGSLTIHSPFVEEKKLRDTLKIYGTAQSIGIGGTDTGDVVKLPTITLVGDEDLSLNEVVTVLSRQTTGAFADDFIIGNIGGEIWQRFTVTLYYARYSASIKPNAIYYKDYRNTNPEWLARSGFLVVGGEIMDVLPGSPAAEAGIVIGDRLEAINGKAMTGIGTDEFYATMKLPIGTQLRLKMRSVDDKEREVTLTLRDLT